MNIKPLTFLKILLFFLLTTPSFGQSESYRLAEIITTDDGLAHNYINSLEGYKNGIILIGTETGFMVFDGYDFQLFNSDSTSQPQLNSHTINSIALDSIEDVWVASNNGVNKVNPFRMTNELFFNLGNEKFPPLQNKYRSITLLTSTPEGKIWIVNDGMICQIVDGEVKQYFPEKYNQVTNIESDGENNIYALSPNSLIGIDPDGKLLFEINQFSSSLFGTQKIENISRLFNTKAGEVILEDDTNNRFYKINPSGKIEDITTENHWLPRLFEEIDRQVLLYQIKSIRKIDILETNHNLIWVATNFGLLKIEVKQNLFETIPELNGVSCTKLFVGSDGLIYGGTIPPNESFIYNPNDKNLQWIENDQDVYDMIALNQDSILMIDRSGYVRIFSQSKQKVIEEVKVPEGAQFLTVFLDENNTLWFAGSKNNLHQSSLSNPLEFSAVKMKDGDVVANSGIWEIYPMDENTFLLGSNNGMIMYDKEKGTQLVFDEESPDGQRVLSNIVNVILEDKKGNVWVASDGGLNYFNVKEKKITKEYSTKNGLCDNVIYSAVFENDSILWLCTANGLSRFNTERETFTNFYEKEGTVGNEFNYKSAVKISSGEIFMGGMKGVTIVDTKKLVFDKTPKNHFVVSYQKYNSSIGKLQQYYLNPNQVKPIIQKPNESFVEIKFLSEDFTSPQRNMFTYKLEGFDEKWIPNTRNNSVRYANLPPGDYLFKLKSTNANGVKNNKVFEIPIIVQQYFYKSKLFIGLVILLIFIGLVGYLLYQYFQYRKNLKLRNKLARDLHDEMSNSFNHIRIIAKEIDPENINQTKNDVDLIYSMSGQAIEKVEDVIWSLNRGNNSVGHVIMKIEDYIDDILRSKNIPASFKKINIDENGSLNYLYRRNILLIFKEAITNTVKHTKPTQVDVIIKDQANSIYFSITNQFNELVQARYSTGLGVPGMKQRAEFINATLEVEQTENQFKVIMIMKKVNKVSFKKK